MASLLHLGAGLAGADDSGFLKIVKEDHGTEGMVVDQLTKYVRKETRAMGRDNHADARIFQAVP